MSSYKRVTCKLCDVLCRPSLSVSTNYLSETFLSEELRESLPQLILNQCPHCRSLWCADSRRDEQILLETYAALPDSYFNDIADYSASYEKLYETLAAYLYQYNQGTDVCDLGCGDGSFLSYLSGKWELYGIEPSARAAEIARQHGLNVQAGTLDTCLEPPVFDSIVAIDVLEHLSDPFTTLRNIRSRLRPGGIFIAVTGDAGAWTARIAGPQWSYLRWAGHVSVLSAMALCTFLRQSGFTIELWERCEHPASPGALAWLRVWSLEPLRRILGRARSWYPYWHDHQLIVARAVNR